MIILFIIIKINFNNVTLQTVYKKKNLKISKQNKNIYCQQNSTPCLEGYKFAKYFEKNVKLNHSKSTFTITLPLNDFEHWFTDWQKHIYSFLAIEKCSNKCRLVYDEPERSDAALFIMKRNAKYKSPVQVILNIEPYGFTDINSIFYATYFPTSKYQVSYAFSETPINPSNINIHNTSWYNIFNQFLTPIKKNAIAAAWLTKSCDRHDNYLMRLMKVISIDMYGPCYNNKKEEDEFPNLRNSHRGIRKIEIGSHYKFYISLENTIIPHYVTEKFYQGFLQDSVMVYLGAPNIDEYQPAENSFINALHFSSPESMGEYLIYLSKNEKEYQKILSWKIKLQNQKVSLLPGFMRAIENSFERIDEKSILCRICNSL